MLLHEHILNSPTYSPSTIQCFEKSQAFGAYQISLRMRNGFNFTNNINETIRHLFESGLFEKWDHDNQREKKHEVPFIPPIQLQLRIQERSTS